MGQRNGVGRFLRRRRRSRQYSWVSFRVSMISVLGAFALCAVGGCKPKQVIGPASGDSWFEDVTDKLGVNFVNHADEATNYFMPFSMGSGGAVFDFDNDGRM